MVIFNSYVKSPEGKHDNQHGILLGFVTLCRARCPDTSFASLRPCCQSLRNGLIKQFLTDVTWGELDALIIDTPPGTSDELLADILWRNWGDKLLRL